MQVSVYYFTSTDLKKNDHTVTGSRVKSLMDLNHILSCKEDAAIYMTAVLSFLRSNCWIYNGHMTRVLSDPNSPLHNIPKSWHVPLQSLTSEEINEVTFGYVKEEWPESLKLFVTSALQLGKTRFLPYELQKNRGHLEDSLPSFLVKGMTLKKINEVEGMAQLVASVCCRNNCTSVLDVGAGMGYLDHVLHYRYGLTVLGVDAAFSHCAQQRIEKSHFAGNHCLENVFHEPFTLLPTDGSMHELQEILNTCKKPIPCSCQLKNHQALQAERTWVIVTLHGCGDLANSVLKFYTMSSSVVGLVCLSCCYHKMSEGSFPLSRCLEKCMMGEENKMNMTALCPYGLRLASQETRARWRKTTQEEHSQRTDHTFFRASIEHALCNRGMEWKRPQRRIGKGFYCNFQTYSQATLAGYDESLQTEAVDSYEKFQVLRPLFLPLALLQVLIQPVLESLIILDKACYLKFEQEDKPAVWLEAVAEETVSPRNIAIVAIKNQNMSQSVS